MHVVIVGAGVFGLWSAHALHAAGVEVTVVEAYGVANSRASSGDESRILRYGYGADALYTRMASASMAAWRGLEERQTDGTPLWHRCGVLWLAPDRDTYLDATIATLREQRLPMRICDSETLSARYPHLAAAETPRALLEPESGAILARRSLHALASELAKNGVRFVMRRALALAEAPAHAVRLDDGRVLRATRWSSRAVRGCRSCSPRSCTAASVPRVRSSSTSARRGESSSARGIRPPGLTFPRASTASPISTGAG